MREYNILLSQTQQRAYENIKSAKKVIWYVAEHKAFLHKSKTEVNMNTFMSLLIIGLLKWNRTVSHHYDMEEYIIDENTEKLLTKYLTITEK
jgi:hypothetical protein